MVTHGESCVQPSIKFEDDMPIYTVSQKGWQPNHGYNFVNSWWICKILYCCKEHYNFNKTNIRLPPYHLTCVAGSWGFTSKNLKIKNFAFSCM